MLIRNAAVDFRRDATGWALRATGELALIGLDGLNIVGSVQFQVNTSDSTTFTFLSATGTGTNVIAAGAVAAGAFSFGATGMEIRAGDTVSLRGSLRISRQLDGSLALALSNASVMVAFSATSVASMSGFASFTISPATGFQLGNFKLTGFSMLSAMPGAQTACVAADPRPVCSQPAPVVTADLVGPVKGSVFSGTSIANLRVRYTPSSGTIDPISVTDLEPEFTISVAGVSGTWTAGTPVAVVGMPNTWDYAITGDVPVRCGDRDGDLHRRQRHRRKRVARRRAGAVLPARRARPRAL